MESSVYWYVVINSRDGNEAVWIQGLLLSIALELVNRCLKFSLIFSLLNEGSNNTISESSKADVLVDMKYLVQAIAHIICPDYMHCYCE